jgi:5-methylcytosine-specific restriction protein A
LDKVAIIGDKLAVIENVAMNGTSRDDIRLQLLSVDVRRAIRQKRLSGLLSSRWKVEHRCVLWSIRDLRMPIRPPLARSPYPKPKRPSPCKVGYGRDWARLASMFKQAHPLCADPFGVHAKEQRIEPSTQVDHITPRKAGGTDEWSNLQALCSSCHSRKTATIDGGFGNPCVSKAP